MTKPQARTRNAARAISPGAMLRMPTPQLYRRRSACALEVMVMTSQPAATRPRASGRRRRGDCDARGVPGQVTEMLVGGQAQWWIGGFNGGGVIPRPCILSGGTCSVTVTH